MKHFYSAALMIMGLLGPTATTSAQRAGTHHAVTTKSARIHGGGGQAKSTARSIHGLRAALHPAKDRPAGTGHFNDRGGPPPNDNCAGAITLTPDPSCVPVAGDVTGATQSIPAITCNAYTGDADDDVWYKFVATATSHTIEVDGSTDFDAVVDLRSGACNGTNIACADATLEDGVETIAAAGLTAGSTYYIRVYHYYTGAALTTGFTICVYASAPAPYNDECADAVPHALSVPGSLTVTGDNTGATDSEGVGYGTAWEQFTITTCANVTIDYCGTTPAFGNFFISLAIGCPFTSVIDAATSVDCGDGNFVMTWPGLSAGTYYIPVLMEPGVAEGPYTFEISTAACGAGPANDNCGSVAFTPLSVGGTITFTGDNTGATPTGDYVTGTVMDDGNSGSVWHGFTTTTCTNLMVEYCGLAPTWDNAWVVLSLNCPADDDLVFNTSFNTADCGDGNVTIYYDNLPAGSYYFPVLLDAINNAVGPYSIDLSATACGGGPANDDCSGAITLAVNPPFDCPANAVTGDNTSAAVTVDAPACDASTAGFQDVWYTFNSGGNSNIVVNLDWGTASDLFIEVLDACGGTSVFCDVVNPAPYNVPVTPGTDYVIRVFSNNDFGVGGVFTICLSGGGAPTPNDDCANAAPVNVELVPDCPANAITGDNTGATDDGGLNTCDPTGTALDVWYTFNSLTNTTVTIDLAPVGGGTMTDWAFVVWDACGGTEVFCAVLPGGPVDVTVVPGIDYVVQVYSNSDFGLPGEFNLCISGAVSTALTETMQADLTVFPNPGNGELNIVSATTSGSVVIELFDVTGRSVHREQVRLTAGAVHAIMPAGRLTQGTYTLRLGTGAGSITRRVVVN